MNSQYMLRTAVITAVMLVVVPLFAQGQSSQDSPSNASAQSQSASKQPDLPSIKQVTDKLDDLYRSKSSHGMVEMTVVGPRGTRSLTIEQWSLGQDNALMVIREPAREAGTATLKVDDGLWNYAPRADRLIRIPSGLLSDSWMGSHFTNDDLMRETSYEDDHTTTLEWITEGGTQYLKATMVPNPKAPVVWQKIEYLMTEKDWLPVRASFYDDGEVVRTMTFSNIQEMGGRRIPTVMTLQPQEEGEYTRMTYKSLQFDTDVDASMFTRQGLRRVARTR